MPWRSVREQVVVREDLDGEPAVAGVVEGDGDDIVGAVDDGAGAELAVGDRGAGSERVVGGAGSLAVAGRATGVAVTVRRLGPAVVAALAVRAQVVERVAQVTGDAPPQAARAV